MAAGIATFMDGGLIGFLFAFAVLFAIGFVGYFLRSIVMWLAWSYVGQSTARRKFLDYLIANRYPAPNFYENSAQDYFARIMDDSSLDPGLRVKAAIEVGTFAAYSGGLQLQYLAKVSSAAESALEEYARRFSASAA